jgi:hypothetical protein
MTEKEERTIWLVIGFIMLLVIVSCPFIGEAVQKLLQ